MHLKFFFSLIFKRLSSFQLNIWPQEATLYSKSGLDIFGGNASFRCLSFKSSGLTHLHVQNSELLFRSARGQVSIVLLKSQAEFWALGKSFSTLLKLYQGCWYNQTDLDLDSDQAWLENRQGAIPSWLFGCNQQVWEGKRFLAMPHFLGLRGSKWELAHFLPVQVVAGVSRLKCAKWKCSEFMPGTCILGVIKSKQGPGAAQGLLGLLRTGQEPRLCFGNFLHFYILIFHQPLQAPNSFRPSVCCHTAQDCPVSKPTSVSCIR